ncbi:MAG TPA: hypothetical protein PK286_13605 [Devosia sp.]|nr:hypothetical protein [Devosia sp.]
MKTVLSIYRAVRPRKVATTEAQAALTKRLHLDHPDLPQSEIAAVVGLNQGRVSEILSGKRFAGVSPA